MGSGVFQGLNSTPLNLLLFHPLGVLRCILRQIGQKLNNRPMYVKPEGPHSIGALLIPGQAKRCISVC